jgi:hypothetical protein
MVGRYLSFGSSANNHLLGELAGLIAALSRWPQAAPLAPPLDDLARRFAREIMAQFAPDGGNREQAFHYHLFALELCLHARSALAALGRPLPAEAESRLRAATAFLSGLCPPSDGWDYGDSDDASVVPFGPGLFVPAAEWRDWARGHPGAAPAAWLGPCPFPSRPPASDAWSTWPASGYATWHDAHQMLRLDASPLGYLAIVAHGHADALHLSAWRDGAPWIVDPGTGAYYADPALRIRLAGWESHNGPHPAARRQPQRRGAFLLRDHHAAPSLAGDGSAITARLHGPEGAVSRRVEAGGAGWRVLDDFAPAPGLPPEFSVAWTLAPDCRVTRLGPHIFRVTRGGTALSIRPDARWKDVHLDEAAPCSPAFREVRTTVAVRATGVPVGSPLITEFRWETA